MVDLLNLFSLYPRLTRINKVVVFCRNLSSNLHPLDAGQLTAVLRHRRRLRDFLNLVSIRPIVNNKVVTFCLDRALDLHPTDTVRPGIIGDIGGFNAEDDSDIAVKMFNDRTQIEAAPKVTRPSPLGCLLSHQQ